MKFRLQQNQLTYIVYHRTYQVRVTTVLRTVICTQSGVSNFVLYHVFLNNFLVNTSPVKVTPRPTSGHHQRQEVAHVLPKEPNSLLNYKLKQPLTIFGKLRRKLIVILALLTNETEREKSYIN